MSVQHLESIDELNKVIDDSSTIPVFLFKHSTRCPVSFRAQSEYLNFVDHNNDKDVLFTHLDLIKHRDVSNTITDRFKVNHQSPQAILVVDEKAVWDASHDNINNDSLLQALSQQTSVS